jgi:hypothetical protein
MIIGRALGDGTELLILGVSRRNIEELLKGRPIKLTTDTHGAGIPLGWTIAIVFGETEAAIAQDLQKAGALTADTKVMAMPREPVTRGSQ